MEFQKWSASLLICLLAVSWPSGPIFAQERTVPPSRQHGNLQAPSEVAVEQVPSVDGDALRAQDRERTDQIGPFRYGKTIETNLNPNRHGTWEKLPSGRWLWRLRIQSQDAVSLSVGFTQFELPSGASVYLHGPDDASVHGPYTADDATGGHHWTPLVEGSEITVELELPADARPATHLNIGKVVHGYRALRGRRTNPPPKSGNCNLDVACEEADPWRDQVRSVARYTYESDGFTFFCSGALVNNTAEDKTPYFMTAEHCISTPEEATSMVFYWNYQNDTCRTPGTAENGSVTDDDPADQTSTGAELQVRFGNWHRMEQIAGRPDLALVEVDDEIPDRFNLFFSGWSRLGTSTEEGVTVHHPQGHGKRISFDEDPSSTTAFGENNSGDTHLRIGNWEVGTTEGGSSGGPLYNREQQMVGVLSGGFAGCVNAGGAEDNNEPDWYGRLAPGFETGDYQNRTLADVLDPTNSGAESISGQPLVNDSIPPARPANFRVDSVTPDSVTLRWTAPGDDNMTGTADEYRLRRRSQRPIESRADFNQAKRMPNLPAPKPAGSSQTAIVPVNQDTSYYFAIVAVDKVNNTSPRAATERDATPVSSLRVLTPPSPNPSRRSATFEFVVDERQPVRADLYDTLGRRVRVLFDRTIPSFRRQTLTTNVSSLSSGVYFLRIRGNAQARTERLVVAK
jgi:lysyl endopeptidase